jgi:4-diphosphocytidyl-2-C-methyl-D-erythritol kinase
MTVLRALAPAKINLGLFLGPLRAVDSRHELATVMQSISLADELTLEPAPEGADGDQVLCPGVPGPAAANLATAAIAAFRARTGWRAPPQRLSIRKRIPIAAGLAGGSADAAAALRLVARAAGIEDRALLLELAAELGADVAAQVSPGRWLASGAGETLEALPPPRGAFGVLVAPLAGELSTAAVYAEADRLGLGRGADAVARLRGELRDSLETGAPLPAARELLHNDLQRAAVSLYPQIAPALARVREAGADFVLLSGSGPTVLGLFARAADAPLAAGVLAARAEAEQAGSSPAAVAAAPVQSDFGEPVPVDGEGGDGDARPHDVASRSDERQPRA